jgi:hypothetical protein
MKLSKNMFRNAIFLNICLFILFLCTLPENQSGIKRIFSSYVLVFALTYVMTKNLKKSLLYSLGINVLLSLLDDNGVFSDYRNMFTKKKENFKIEPAGDGEEAKTYGKSKTESKDNTHFDDEDLDKILDKDEEESKKENEHLKKAGGGLDQLKDLLEMAKKESPYSDKKDKDYTPAEAQRATFRLIDTVKQLKSTMAEMMPLMKTGHNLMDLHKKMNGIDSDKKDK